MIVAPPVLAAIEAHAAEAAAEECCGLLIGTSNSIVDCVRASNRAPQPHTRYEIDAADHFAAIRRARATGLAVIGAYHSHPRSAPVPSPTDRTEAFDDFVFVIAGRTDGQPAYSIRAWRLISGTFVEVQLVSIP